MLIPAHARDSSHTALVDADAGTALTYRELDARVQALAPLWERPQTLVFLFCSNTAETVIGYLAALRARQAVALLDARLQPDFRRNLVRRYAPETVLAPAEGELELDGYARSDAPLEGLVAWRGARVGDPVHPDLALLLSTSGSTGSPKFVRLSRDAVLTNAAQIAHALELSPTERPISSLPLNYSYGLSVLNSHLSVGATVVLTDASLMEARYWKALEEQRCTSMAGVPYTWQMVRRLGLDRLDLPSLTSITQAGGRLEGSILLELHERMSRKGGRLYVMYGQTEATARISVLSPSDLPERVGWVGPALRGGRLQILGAEGPTSEPGVSGEVIYTGPNVMMGYASGRADLTSGDELGGVLHTGDLGEVDEGGRLRVTGRSKRIAKVFGLRVNLDEVEALLASRGPVAVVGRPDALEVFCEFASADGYKALRKEVASALRVNHRALRFHHLGELPLTSTGKPDYERLPETP